MINIYNAQTFFTCSKSHLFCVQQFSLYLAQMEIKLDLNSKRNHAYMTNKKLQLLIKEEKYTNSASARSLLKKEPIENANNIFEEPQQINFIDQVKKKKKNSFVRLFIDRLKRIDSKYLDMHSINNKYIGAMSKITKNIEGTNTIKIEGIHANRIIKMLISILTVFTILSVHLISTYRWFFNQQRNTQYDKQRQMGVQIFCLVCSCIKIFSGFTFWTKVMGKSLILLKDIAVHYVTSTDFYLDFLVLLSTILLMAFDNSTFAGIFGFFASLTNLAYIQRMEQTIEIILNTTKKKQIFALIRLLFANILIAHLIATIMLLMTFVDDKMNWMRKYGISEHRWWEQYLYSIYWASTVTTTVGFGDIVASNIGQTIVLTAIMLFGCLVLSYNISQVANIISNLQASSMEKKNKLAVLKKLARVRKIDVNLHSQIGEYIINATQLKRNFEFQEGDELINSLPTHIQENLSTQSANNFFSSLPFFFLISSPTKKIIYEKLKLEVLSPKQYITHKRMGLTKIFILRMGEAGFAYKKAGSSLNGTILDSVQVKNETKNPELLNIYLLTRGKQLQYDIVCKEYCVVSTLEYEQLTEALNTSQQDYQFYHKIMDAVHFQGNQWGRTKCNYCDTKHSIFVCPKLHFMPLRSITYMKHQRRISKDRLTLDLNGLVRNIKSQIMKQSSLKLYCKYYVNLQQKQGVDVIKRQQKKTSSLKLINQKIGFLKDWVQAIYIHNQQEVEYFDVDIPQDYQTYFPEHNSGKLKQKNLKLTKSRSTEELPFY